jgi:hypothetical protein
MYWFHDFHLGFDVLVCIVIAIYFNYVLSYCRIKRIDEISMLYNIF